ncbi:MAG: cobyric acid synthase [Spirochaetes bacterium]|nr:cobyric acid synthase [Spirochaetota bacterium]
MSKNIMVLGTASSVGKSIIAAALCRIFVQDGFKTAPFKSQNMALNSFVTKDGGEMGRAQVVQAEACGIDPSVLMNPVLLKPTSDRKAQVIINGKVFQNMDAVEYHEFKPQVKGVITEAYNKLSSNFDVIVLEGAGSPAEINLRENDVVNMGMAEMVDAPVLLVADIDKGGVFASIYGTIALLKPEEKERVKGVIINKFRGDVKLLEPGIKTIEEMTGVPVLGVIPYVRVELEDEDSVTERFKRKEHSGEIKIDVIRLPRISNFSDFDAFGMHEDVSLNYVETADQIEDPDIIIIPGSKNTVYDMSFLNESGIDKKILDAHKNGTLLFGICAGFQMLGDVIEDPHGIEGPQKSIKGLGIFKIGTSIAEEKVTRQVKGTITANTDMLQGLKDVDIQGYEIHMGRSSGLDDYEILAETDNGVNGITGNNAVGTYLHGIFDSVDFTRGLLNNVRERKGLKPLQSKGTFSEKKEGEFNKLAKTVRDNIDMKMIYKILNNGDVSSN